MPHEDHHKIPESGFRLSMVVALNLVITVAEVIGGLLSNSLSLISDAVHNFSDGLAAIIAWIAMRLNQRPADQHYTFGYKRAEVIAASINAGTLAAISVYLCIEAVNRLLHPHPITGSIMAWVALIGLIANIVGTGLLYRGSKKNTNLYALYLHLLSDALSSLGVVIGGIAISYFNITWIDPVLTILIGLYILKESIAILKREMDMFMLAVPSRLSMDDIRKAILSVRGVDGLHHVHLWEVDEGDIHLEAHIKVRDKTVKETDKIRRLIEETLNTHFNILHVILQVECLDTPCETEDRL